MLNTPVQELREVLVHAWGAWLHGCMQGTACLMHGCTVACTLNQLTQQVVPVASFMDQLVLEVWQEVGGGGGVMTAPGFMVMPGGGPIVTSVL
eukprot:CAMPEP_0202897852 /NCGR_PEP_ID=MMETSP1392-20130828/6516_1 /ASSEMBLY_ACC=CAM_ASM_000868 /TAXON_ID=225041 /ORGANISM="Chlamydomonas chlamydogama, Strain SAG 11-48b" /LENGTH=92 /DNA_ID=CAMNT_0049583611 /DNA_START=1060 /DNA_END=1338 /DNA_ORIENTATION=+